MNFKKDTELRWPSVSIKTIVVRIFHFIDKI